MQSRRFRSQNLYPSEKPLPTKSIQNLGQPKQATAEQDCDLPRTSRHAQRSAATRAALLQAAGQIFARDGFEAARIEDIATEAGRSRGAFYANFTTKTELFLALREQAVRKRAREIRESIQGLTDAASRNRSIKAYLVQEILNQRQSLLEIEFKLFAVRRPEMLQELADKHIEASCRINQEELAPHMPEWRDEGEAVQRNTLAMEATIEGLALNHLFQGTVLGATAVAALLPGLIDAILEAPCGAPDDPCMQKA